MLQQGEHLSGRPPEAFFPITSQNMKTNFPKIMDQFFSADIKQYRAFKKLVYGLYTPDAQFHYPLASLKGRDAVVDLLDLLPSVQICESAF